MQTSGIEIYLFIILTAYAYHAIAAAHNVPIISNSMISSSRTMPASESKVPLHMLPRRLAEMPEYAPSPEPIITIKSTKRITKTKTITITSSTSSATEISISGTMMPYDQPSAIYIPLKPANMYTPAPSPESITTITSFKTVTLTSTSVILESVTLQSTPAPYITPSLPFAKVVESTTSTPTPTTPPAGYQPMPNPKSSLLPCQIFNGPAPQYGQIQPGANGGCNKWLYIHPGDTCDSVAQICGNTGSFDAQQLENWNDLDKNCGAVGSKPLWANGYACIGVQ